MTSFRTAPTSAAVERLKIVDGGCYTTVAYIFEDPDGQLWHVSKGPLQDPTTDKWWTLREVVSIDADTQYLLYNCPGSAATVQPDCAQAGSYQLREWATQLAEARATGRVIEVRV